MSLCLVFIGFQGMGGVVQVGSFIQLGTDMRLILQCIHSAVKAQTL